MKKLLLLTLVSFLLVNCKKTKEVKNHSNTIASITETKKKKEKLEKFPIEKLNFYEANSDRLKIVVFMPSLYLDCEYASMLTTSLNHYFVKGLAFNTELKPKLDVLLLVNDSDKWKDLKEQKEKNFNTLKDIYLKYDKDGEIYNSLAINTFDNTSESINPETISDIDVKKIPLTRNASSILLLLNKNDEIIYRDNNYRSEGEGLKPLEAFIKKHLNTDYIEIKTATNKTLKIGDKIPNFLLDGPSVEKGTRILDKKDKVKIITFYPAAFTGVIQKYDDINKSAGMTCASQMKSFNANFNKDLIEVFGISSSSNQILDLWEKHLESENITYLNDNDYTISQLFDSYNSETKYNVRKTYLIDKEGIIKYIDDDYAFDDNETLIEEIEKII